MRRNRIIFLLLWIISVVGISFYGGPVSYGFFIVLSAIPPVSLFYIICVMAGFKIYQRLDGRNPVSNTTSPFFFTLQNESPFIISGIRVVFHSDYSVISGLDDQTEYELLPHGGIKKETDLICRYRGEYEVGIKKIIVQDYFRLFKITYNNREPLNVIVKPAVVRLDELGSDPEAVCSGRDSYTSQTEPDVTVREYRPTDDKRMINWRATAASQKLMTRQMSGEQQQGISVIMDPKRYSNRPCDYIPVENKMLETAIALVLYYCSRSVPVGVISAVQGSYESIRNGIDGFESFYEKMSGFSFDADADMTVFYRNVLSCPGITESRMLYYITFSWDEKDEEFVTKLCGRGLEVTAYVIGKTDHAAVIPRLNIVSIPEGSDLTEVMR